MAKNKKNIPLKAASVVMTGAMVSTGIPIATVMAVSDTETETGSMVVTEGETESKQQQNSVSLGINAVDQPVVVDDTGDTAMSYYLVSSTAPDAPVSLDSNGTVRDIIKKFVAQALGPKYQGMVDSMVLLQGTKTDVGVSTSELEMGSMMLDFSVPDFVDNLAGDYATFVLVNQGSEEMFATVDLKKEVSGNTCNIVFDSSSLRAPEGTSSYTVTFAAGDGAFTDGSAEKTVTVKDDAFVDLDEAEQPGKENYDFNVWKSGETVLPPGKFYPTANVTLTANYLEDESDGLYAITYLAYNVKDVRSTVIGKDENGNDLDVTEFCDNDEIFDSYTDAETNDPLKYGDEVTKDTIVMVNTLPKKTLVFVDDSGNEVKRVDIGISDDKTIGDYLSELPSGTYTDTDGLTIGLDTVTSELYQADASWSDVPEIQVTSESSVPDVPTECTVTFDANEGVLSGNTTKSVVSGEAIGELPTPTREGYIFAGWYTAATGGSRVTASTKVSDDMTVYARWTRSENTITFDAQGGSFAVGFNATKKVPSGDAIGTLPTVTRDGYKFKEWNTAANGSGTTVTVDTVPTSGITYYAIWEEVSNKVTVTFDANGGTCSETNRELTAGDLYGVLPTPTREGYNFTGWYTEKDGGSRVTQTMNVNENITLYAHWAEQAAENPVTSLVIKQGDKEVSEITVDYGADLGLSYTFAPANADNARFFWTSSNEDVIKVSGTDSFTYMGSGTTTLTLSTADGTKTASVTVTVRERKSPVTSITFNKPEQTVNVADEEHNVDLSFTYGPAYADNAVFEFSSSDEEILKVASDGKSWEYGGKFGTVTITVRTADGTCEASMKVTVVEKDYVDPTPDEKIYHRLSVNYGDGNIGYQVEEHGTTITLPENPTREGYTFDGWYLMDGTKVTEVTLNADMTVYARWTAVEPVEQCEVLIDAQNGNPVVWLSYEKGTKLGQLPGVTRDGYTFTGWFTAASGGQAVNADTVVNGDMTIYAQWTEKDPQSYSLTLDPNADNGQINGASGVQTLSTKLVDGHTSLNNLSQYQMTRQGYSFAGWFDAPEGGEMVYDAAGYAVDGTYWTSGNYMGGQNLTVYAHWTKNVTTYALKFDVRGGNPIDDIMYDANTLVTTFPEPTRAGYTFLGWFDAATNGNRVTSVTMTQDTKLYAQWEKIPEAPKTAYIAFVTQTDEISIGSMTVDVGTEVQLPNLTRNGYTFDGWYTEKEGGNRVLSLTATEDVTLYAHWTKIGDTQEPDEPETKEYTVTFDYQDGSVKTVTESVGTPMESLPMAAREGYEFVGWFDAPEGGNQVTSYDGDKDVTFYAQWKKLDNETPDEQTFKLNFDTQGGALIESMTVTAGTRVDTFPTPVRDGYEFLGWYSKAEGGQKVSAVIMQSDTTIYAQWKSVEDTEEPDETTYTVILDDQNGNVSTLVENVGTPFTAFTTPVREGYTFLGWFDAKEGGNRVTSYDGDKDVTFYAQWQKADDETTEKKVMTLKLNMNEVTVTYGDPLNLKYTFGPSDATNALFVWSSSNPNVIKYENGKMTYTGVGETVIRIATVDGSISDECRVTVKAKDTNPSNPGDNTGNNGGNTDNNGNSGGNGNTDNTGNSGNNGNTDNNNGSGNNGVTDGNIGNNNSGNGGNTDNTGSGTETPSTVYTYSVTITMSDGSVKKISELKSDKIIAEVAEALGLSVSSFTVKTATQTETAISGDTQVKTIADMAEDGDVLLIGLDASGQPIGSAKVTKVGENEYTVSMSKDTDVALSGKEGQSDNSDVAGDGKGKGADAVATEGKSDESAQAVKTADTAALPVFGGLAVAMTSLLSGLAFWKKRRN